MGGLKTSSAAAVVFCYEAVAALSGDTLRLIRGLDTRLSRPSIHFHAHESRSHEHFRTFGVLKHEDHEAALESDMSYEPGGADVGYGPQTGGAGRTAIHQLFCCQRHVLPRRLTRFVSMATRHARRRAK